MLELIYEDTAAFRLSNLTDIGMFGSLPCGDTLWLYWLIGWRLSVPLLNGVSAKPDLVFDGACFVFVSREPPVHVLR